jgi:hypothetical protein
MVSYPEATSLFEFVQLSPTPLFPSTPSSPLAAAPQDVIQVPALADHARSSSPMITKAAGELADVIAERDRVNALTDFSGTPIVVRDIQKIYPGQDGGKPKVMGRVCIT